MQRFYFSVFLLAFIGQAAADAQTPYELRGAVLGMTLQEAREMKWPDGPGGYWGHSEFVCHGDKKGNSIPYGRTETKFGVTVCNWQTPPLELNRGYTTPYLAIGKDKTDRILYRFMARPGEEQPRLFSISVSMSNGMFHSLVEAMTKKYGKPTRKESGAVQNAYGATYSDARVTWRNGVSTIRLLERPASVNEMSMHFELDELQALYQKKKDEAYPSQL